MKRQIQMIYFWNVYLFNNAWNISSELTYICLFLTMDIRFTSLSILINSFEWTTTENITFILSLLRRKYYLIINMTHDIEHRYFYCWLLGISISIPLNSRHSLIGNPYILRVYNYHHAIISEIRIWLGKGKTIISDKKFNFPCASAIVAVFRQYNKYQFSYTLSFPKRIGSEKSNQDDVTFSLFIFMLIDWI